VITFGRETFDDNMKESLKPENRRENPKHQQEQNTCFEMFKDDEFRKSKSGASPPQK